MIKRIFIAIVLFLPLSTSAVERLELLFGKEKDGLVEVFYIEAEKAKKLSENTKRSGNPIHPGVDPLEIARGWGMANLGKNAKVESIHLWHRKKCEMKVHFYMVRINNFNEIVSQPYKMEKRIILILGRGEVITGEWVNSKEFFSQFNNEKSPNPYEPPARQ